jgi:hypothetical protein
MKMEDGNMYGNYQEVQEIGTGVPNEAKLPHLHAITFRRDLALSNNHVLRKSDVSATTLVDHEIDILEAREKILAILKMILNNDSLAAEYVLLCLLSKVHTRKDGLILGNISFNITNITTPQVK